MLRGLIVFLVISTAFASSVLSVDAVKSVFSISQVDNTKTSPVLLYVDTADIVLGVSALGTMLPISIDVQATEIDSNAVTYQVHVVSIGRQPATYAREFRIEYGLTARIQDIRGKDGIKYLLEITALSQEQLDTTYCGMLHTRKEDYNFDPSANLDIYYVPKTLGDIYWNAAKGLMEAEYKKFRALNHFNLPGKYSLFLNPCKIHSVLWDNRFGMVVDPTRNTMFSIFTKEFNSTYPFLILHASAQRNYGYAPPFLSEGFAGFYSDGIWGMKQYIAEGLRPSLDSVLDTYSFLTMDPVRADRMSSSFVRYLVDQYGLDTFLDLYRKTNDLNLRQSLESSYDKPIGQLEREWSNYLDTVKISSAQLREFSDISEVLFQYEMMKEYSFSWLHQADSFIDSIAALGLIVRSEYFSGDYANAAKYQKLLTELNPILPNAKMALGSYLLMNGDIESSKQSFSEAFNLDTSGMTSLFNWALADICSGDTISARERLMKIVSSNSEGPIAQSRIMLAGILEKSAIEEDKQNAKRYYREAVNMLSNALRSNTPSSQAMMWSGIALLGLGDTDGARDHLISAEFIETRAFYLGMINLWLGKVADTKDDRDNAKLFYKRVLSGKSAMYHREEAKALLVSAYKK